MAGITVAVVLFGAAAAMPVSAGADPVAATRSAIAAMQAQVAGGAAQLHALTLAYNQASLEAANLATQVQADRMQIGHLQQRVRNSESMLRQEALLSYTAGPDQATPVTPDTHNDPSVRAAYLQVAAGTIFDAVDQFRAEQHLLATAEAQMTAQQRSEQRAADAVAQARQQALTQAAAEQARLEQLQAQLSQAEQAAALAAQKQAQSATQGLPVNGGMVAVVHSIVTGGGAGGVWLQLRQCESSDNYRENSGNGYYGAYQFSEDTWSGLGYPGRPDLEPPAMQDQAAQVLQARNGWGQWPACAAALGLT